MNMEDLFSPPQKIESAPWQIGSKMMHDIPENGIAIFFCGDYRGGDSLAYTTANSQSIREQFYPLSAYDFQIPIADLGDLISGKTHQDTLYIVEEILSACMYKNTLPILVGGSNDLAFAMVQALQFHQKNIQYTQINPKIELSTEGEELNEINFLQKLFNSKLLNITNYHHLAYQKHLNEIDALKLMKSVEFDVIRLAEMMGDLDQVEPFFRRADLVS